MNDDWTKELREHNNCSLLESNTKLDELGIKKFQKVTLHIYTVKNIFFHNESMEVFRHKNLVH